MAPDVTSVKYINGHRLEVTFEDGLRAEIDLKPHILNQGGVFQALEDPAYFAQVSVNHDIGTIVWPNDADLAPEFLYRLTIQTAVMTSLARGG